MVNVAMEEPRCGQCPEVVGERWQGYCFCAFLNQDVWANSVMCPHGKFLAECF